MQARFAELGIRVRSVHRAKDPAALIRAAEAICVGGGNTFALAKKMQQQGLMKAILRKIKAGTPYVGWSAGSNVLPALTICDDQRHAHRGAGVVSGPSGAVKFQINPHYLDANPAGHAGRDARAAHVWSTSQANPRRCAVAGLREGCMLRCENGKLELIGRRPMRMFRKGSPKRSRSNPAAISLFYYK